MHRLRIPVVPRIGAVRRGDPRSSRRGYWCRGERHSRRQPRRDETFRCGPRHDRPAAPMPAPAAGRRRAKVTRARRVTDENKEVHTVISIKLSLPRAPPRRDRTVCALAYRKNSKHKKPIRFKVKRLLSVYMIIGINLSMRNRIVSGRKE